MYKFPVVIKSELNFMSQIHPLKQKIVMDIVEKYCNVSGLKITLFGSSISERCGIRSDIDLAIKLSVVDDKKFYSVMREVSELCNGEADVLFYNTITNARLLEEINNGIVIVNTL